MEQKIRVSVWLVMYSMDKLQWKLCVWLITAHLFDAIFIGGACKNNKENNKKTLVLFGVWHFVHATKRETTAFIRIESYPVDVAIENIERSSSNLPSGIVFSENFQVLWWDGISDETKISAVIPIVRMSRKSIRKQLWKLNCYAFTVTKVFVHQWYDWPKLLTNCAPDKS